MPMTAKVTCDQCGKDLTETGNCEDYRLTLQSERIPSRRGGTVTAMAANPDLKRPHYFCGLQCLILWVEGNYRKGELLLEDAVREFSVRPDWVKESVADPCWDTSGSGDDWRRFVPPVVQDNWEQLSTEARLAVFCAGLWAARASGDRRED